MEEYKIKVYIRVDGNGNVTDVNSSIFLSDITGWIQIDEGTGDKYAHAQGYYFDKPIITDEGIYYYKYVDGAVVEKTAEAIVAEIENLPPTPPTEMEVVQDEVTTLQIALVDQYEENLQLQEEVSQLRKENEELQDEVTNTQIAIVELYEGGL